MLSTLLLSLHQLPSFFETRMPIDFLECVSSIAAPEVGRILLRFLLGDLVELLLPSDYVEAS